MAKAVREMQEMISTQRVDLLIETRDARLPLTSYNPVFEQLVRSEKYNTRTKRLIVYNKRDLAQPFFREPVSNATHAFSKDPVMFTHAASKSDVSRLLATIRDICVKSRPLMEDENDKYTVLISGMPNVGKSTLLNALRNKGVNKGKAASTSPEPGHTRAVSTLVKISERPPVYIYDSPGIMVPYFGAGTDGKEAALKLALTGGIKEGLFHSSDVLIDYLLWRYQMRDLSADDGFSINQNFLDILKLPHSTNIEDPVLFMEALARRLGKLQKGGLLNTEYTNKWLIRQFRSGAFGNWTLDSLGRRDEVADYYVPPSKQEYDGDEVMLPPIDPKPVSTRDLAPEIVESTVQKYLETPPTEVAPSRTGLKKLKKEELGKKRAQKMAEKKKARQYNK